MRRGASGGNEFIPGYEVVGHVTDDGVVRIHKLQYFPGTTSRRLDPLDPRDLDLIELQKTSEVTNWEYGQYRRGREVVEKTDKSPDSVLINLWEDDILHTHPNGIGLPSAKDMKILEYSPSGVERVLGRQFPTADRFLRNYGYTPIDIFIETTYRRLPGAPTRIQQL